MCCPFVGRELSVIEIVDELCSPIVDGCFGIRHSGIMTGDWAENSVGRDVDARILNAMYWNGSLNLIAKLTSEGSEGISADVLSSWNLDEIEEFEFCCQALD